MRLKQRLETLDSRLNAFVASVGRTDYRNDAVAFAREALGLRLDPWQARVLGEKHQQAILNICRQAGKSTMAAVLALHEALYRPGSLTLLVSPSQRQSSELFRKVIELRDMLPWRVTLTEDNRLSMKVQGGGRVVSLPGSEKTIRGHSAVSLLIEDEASRIDDSLHYSVMPMLATTRGRMLMMSTPWVKSGVFYDVWHNGVTWHREQVSVHDVPRIDPAWVEEQRANVPDMIFRSEYMCEFLDSVDGVFQFSHVMNCLSDDVLPLFGIPS